MGNAVSDMCCQDKQKPQTNSSLTHQNTNGSRVNNTDSVSLIQKDPQSNKKPAAELKSLDRDITPTGDPLPPPSGPGGAQREQLNTLRPSALDTGDKKKVSLDDFVLKKVVGRGSFGKVHLALHKPTNQLVALKKLKKKEIEERMQVENVLNEKKILQTSIHPFIVRLLFAFQNEGNIYLGMEYMPGGELFHHLRQHRRFNAQGALFYASEVLLALEYLHDQGIIYRDLKPENILLDKDGHIKVTDFGLSKIDKITNSFCGTPEYFAPEIILGSGYGREVDWWSFGCFLYEIMVGKPPFQDANRSKLYKMIIEGKVNYPDSVSLQARDLISKLLNPVAEERLGAKSAKDVKQHPFFISVNWNQVYNREVKPPFKPSLKNLEDTGNFDAAYTREPVKETLVDPSNLKYDEFTYQDSAMAKNM